MDEVIPKIGHKLRAARRLRGLSQEAVAVQLGLDRIAVSNWENDKNYPDIPNLHRLAELYDVSIDEVMGRGPAPSMLPYGETWRAENPVRESAQTYERDRGVQRDTGLVRAVLVGVLEPLGLRVTKIDIDRTRGLRVAAEWAEPVRPRPSRRK